MLATIAHGDLSTLFVVLAIVGFAISLYLVYVGNFIAALVAALISVVILVYGA